MQILPQTQTNPAPRADAAIEITTGQSRRAVVTQAIIQLNSFDTWNPLGHSLER